MEDEATDVGDSPVPPAGRGKKNTCRRGLEPGNNIVQAVNTDNVNFLQLNSKYWLPQVGTLKELILHIALEAIFLTDPALPGLFYKQPRH